MRKILAAAILSLAAGAASGAPDPLAPRDAASRGLYIALRVCVACHAVGPQGVSPDGGAPPFANIWPAGDGRKLRLRLGEISEKGHGEMPRIAMTPQQVEDVAVYIESVAPVPGKGVVVSPS